MGTAGPELWGCDFSSAPSRRKPVLLACGRLRAGRVLLERLESFETQAGFGDRLAEPGHWVGGFDLPFGLPRELVQALGWPTDWAACMAHYAALDRAAIRDAFFRAKGRQDALEKRRDLWKREQRGLFERQEEAVNEDLMQARYMARQQ